MKKNLHSICKYIFIFIISYSQTLTIWAQTGTVDIGKSFANITKISTGGTFNPSDIIEIRVTFAVRATTTTSQITVVQVFDTVPAKTTYVPNSMRIATNEGITYKGPFSDAVDADPASSAGGNVLINLGTGATGAIGGTITNTSKPTFYGSTCIMVACFRVQINASANYGDTIKIGGRVLYKLSGVAKTINFPQYRIILSLPNTNACLNGTSISAASDSLGTFASGTTQNRATALAFTTTYIKQNLGVSSPQDYNYSIANNSSANGSTNPNAALPDATRRVFGLWDIGGDHTGASNPSLGNAPVAPGTRGGYMVLINSSYKTDTAYRETLTNLCPNTYYEFSAWFRNICPRCGCDSTGKGSSTAGYITGPGNDSSGVKPNITFLIDGLAYYTTGDISYTRTTPWKKFGFAFLTKPTQTTANFLIRNNSPGGGGNDWVMDDIQVSHCGPSLTMNFNPEVLTCKESATLVTLSDTIRYLYNNSYVYFKWQKSNVGGTIWTDMVGAGTSGTGTPVLINGQYQYQTSLPPFPVTYADSGTYYRVLVATTAANLASGTCHFTDGNMTMIRVITCGIILNGEFIQFKGNIIDKKTYLTWTTSGEQKLSQFEIEKSSDGIHFAKIGIVGAKNTAAAYYNFSDPDEIVGHQYYRLKMLQQDNLYKYSNVIALNATLSFDVNIIQNPFIDNINIDITVPAAATAHIQLFNNQGQKLKILTQQVNKGSNKIMITELGNLSKGIYFISIEYKNENHRRKMVKL
jgi:hypothetical protein